MSFLIPFDFHKGDRLDDGLTVDMPITHGGHGDLYLVHDDDGTPLALKVIRKADNVDEFNGIEQCRAVSSHISGLLPVLKIGKLADGRVYCVMPPADNLAEWPDYEPDTLANRIRLNGRIAPDKVMETAGRILVTIGELHDARLAHCDIKPDNILFIGEEPKLADYSLLSDIMNGSASLSSGTVGFIPPEMLDNPSCYDPAACDLYAVGKLIYCAWSGSDALLFPSVSKDIDLHEIGIVRPLYMKACNTSPSRRFRSADEFISAVDEARSRLNRSVQSHAQSIFRKKQHALLFVLLILLCVIGLLNFVLFLQLKSGKAKRETDAGAGMTDPLYFSIIPVPDDNEAADGNTAPRLLVEAVPVPVTDPPIVTTGRNVVDANGGKQLGLPPDPLVVTTELDVVDANDGENSLREALGYAQRHGAGATLSFSRDCRIRLSSPLSVTQNVIIDGGENRITLIGPETKPMFQVKEAKLTLKNMSLVSDYAGGGGGILDAKAPGRVVLSSVRDGGAANCLWCISDKFDMDLEDVSHLHRVRVNPNSMGGNIRIKTGSILEDLVFTGDTRNMGEGNCDVYEHGLLKNVSVSDSGDIYVNSGGTAENITVKENGFLQVRPGGTVNGVRVEFGGVMGYMDKGIVTGTISIGGVAWEPGTGGLTADGTQTFPVIDDRKTDIVFDLTERTETSLSRFNYRAEVAFSALNNIIGEGPVTRLLFNDLASFLGAHGYAVRVRDDQPPGTYLLGTQADKFDAPVSLEIGGKVYPDALMIGKPFSAGNRVYTLSLDYTERQKSSRLTNHEARTLMLGIAEE